MHQTEASILAQKYSAELAKGNAKAQELAATLNKAAMAQQTAYNAMSAMSRFQEKAAAAGATGKNKNARPFPPGHPLAYSWISGFIEGKAEREQSQGENRPIRLPRARP